VVLGGDGTPICISPVARARIVFHQLRGGEAPAGNMEPRKP